MARAAILHVMFQALSTALLTLAVPALQAPGQDAAPSLEIGPAAHRYRWVPDWLQLPDGMALGNTHGCVVCTEDGRVVFNTDSKHAVVIANPDGTIHSTFGEEWKGGLHGMALREEDGEEFLYLAHTGRHEVAKVTLEGDVVWTLPWPEASGKYTSEAQYKPTAVAVAPDGTIYVGDGYGQNWVHRFSKERAYLGSFGGPGTEPGRMRTPHGLILEALGDDEHVITVCDRENRRLQRFGLDGELLRAEEAVLARPCSGVQLPGGVLAVAELAGRVTLLGLDDGGERVVLGRLAEQPDPKKRATNRVAREDWRDGEFLSPHGIGADAAGNLFVLDWSQHGRVTKLERVEPFGK